MLEMVSTRRDLPNIHDVDQLWREKMHAVVVASEENAGCCFCLQVA